MTNQKISRWVSSEWFVALASFFTLVTFVVAQSVYQVLAANEEFLAVRGVSNGQLLQIILVFTLLPALLLFFVWALLRRLHGALARGFASVVYFVLFLAFFLQIYNAYLIYADWWLRFRFSFWDRQPFVPAYLLCVIPALLLGVASLRFEKPFRSFIVGLSPVVLIFPGLFLARTWTATSLPLPKEKRAVPTAIFRVDEERFPPVLMLVFDELTLYALVDKSGQIDGDRFPHFRKLAEESYWFRNTTANADHTTRSISVILTGGFPRGYSASYNAYPDNLLTLLSPFYEIHVHEMYTHFCDPRLFHCPEGEITTSRIELLRDVSYLYLARVLPKSVRIQLPNMTRSWGPFLEDRELLNAWLQRFERFLDSLSSIRGQNVYFYFHDMLPHSPYLLTPDGEIQEADSHGFPRAGAADASRLKKVQERYFMQIAFADKQLGRFIAQLKDMGLYEKSLLIVTADHGVSYEAKAPGRFLEEGANPGMVLTVPLFIKVPFQEQGAVSDRDVQLIDLTPTVADLLCLEVAWPHAGRSVFAPPVESRKKVAYDRLDRRYEFPVSVGFIQVERESEVAAKPAE